MEDNERIEGEIEQMLNHFRSLERLLNSNRNKTYIENEGSSLSSQIVVTAKKIDNMLNKTDFFEDTEEELDEKLKRLQEENTKSHTQFEQIKASAGI